MMKGTKVKVYDGGKQRSVILKNMNGLYYITVYTWMCVSVDQCRFSSGNLTSLFFGPKQIFSICIMSCQPQPIKLFPSSHCSFSFLILGIWSISILPPLISFSYLKLEETWWFDLCVKTEFFWTKKKTEFILTSIGLL